MAFHKTQSLHDAGYIFKPKWHSTTAFIVATPPTLNGSLHRRSTFPTPNRFTLQLLHSSIREGIRKSVVHKWTYGGVQCYPHRRFGSAPAYQVTLQYSRKRGRTPKAKPKPVPVKRPVTVPPPAKKIKVVKEGEDVCFICFDGGSLVLCDHRGCPKAYHPACIKGDEEFFESAAKWNCGWHICSICQKTAHHMCYTCTYSLCRGCVRKADYVSVRGTSKVDIPYKIDNKLVDIMLEVLNLDKKEIISIDAISDQEFSENVNAGAAVEAIAYSVKLRSSPDEFSK